MAPPRSGATRANTTVPNYRNWYGDPSANRESKEGWNKFRSMLQHGGGGSMASLHAEADADIASSHQQQGGSSSNNSSSGVTTTSVGNPNHQTLSILLVGDFFYPNVGGVESHMYLLGQCLRLRGHRVSVLTHSYGARAGVRYLTNGIRVYYAPMAPFFNQATFMTLSGSLPMLRNILVREGVQVVHGHQAFSSLAHECIFYAKLMGLKTVFTDHSLGEFASGVHILANKMLRFLFTSVDHVVTVSNTGRENTVLRGFLNPLDVSVIPNALDCSLFTPNPSARDRSSFGAPSGLPTLTIVVVSRLVYRKGIDLLADVIPVICKRFDFVRFVIGGDGPKKVPLEEMVQKEQLDHRVEFLGNVKSTQVRDVLVRGDIFLNCSLTEAFCIAIVEAASCGLLVVSTAVGGVPEVLPADICLLTEPTSIGLIERVAEAVAIAPRIDPLQVHQRVKKMYSWHSVAARNERVYRNIMNQENGSTFSRLERLWTVGPVAGPVFALASVLVLVLFRITEYCYPRHMVHPALPFPNASVVTAESEEHFIRHGTEEKSVSDETLGYRRRRNGSHRSSVSSSASPVDPSPGPFTTTTTVTTAGGSDKSGKEKAEVHPRVFPSSRAFPSSSSTHSPSSLGTTSLSSPKITTTSPIPGSTDSSLAL